MDSLHALAKKLAPGPQVTPSKPSVALSVGRGEILASGTSGQVTLYLNRSPTAVKADRLASVPPLKKGDIVECLIVGTRIIVLGPFGGVSSSTLVPLPLSWTVELPSSGSGLSVFSPTPVFMPVDSLAKVQLIGAVFWASDGTNLTAYTLNITQNGTPIPALTGIPISYFNSPEIVPITPVDVANNDGFNIEATHVGGFGCPISVTLYFSVTD